MQKQKRAWISSIILLSGLMLFLFPTTTGADDNVVEPDEAPAFNSPAQVQRAENLAAATATEPDEETREAIAQAEQKAAERDTAQADYDAMVEKYGADSPEARQALTELETAEEAYTTAQNRADEKLAGFAGVSADEIEAMRTDGMGWGEIAHELGLHPGALGLGNGKTNPRQKAKMKGSDTADEVESATARNLETGWGQGRGKGGADASGGKSSSNGKSDRNKEKKDNDKGGGKNKKK